MHHILVLLQSKDFMVDPHNHTKHSSCRRSHYQTQLFIFKGRKISLMSGQKACERINYASIIRLKELSER